MDSTCSRSTHPQANLMFVPQACLFCVSRCRAVHCHRNWTPAVCLNRCGLGLNDSEGDSTVTLGQNAKVLSLGNILWVKQ